jgi:cell wall-associated NlpC family hydrolase
MHLSHSFRVLVLSLAVAATVAPARADETKSLSLSDGTSTTITSSVANTVTNKLRAAGQRLVEGTSHVTEYALGMLGIQYKFGGNSPESGFDCSGLVRHVFQQVTGISLPHNAAEQSKSGREVAQEELRPGDLVFFNTRKFAFSHVGIYLGDNKFVHAPRKGKPVQVVDITHPYWQKAYDGARRLLETAPQVLIPQAFAHTPQVTGSAAQAFVDATEPQTLTPLPETKNN